MKIGIVTNYESEIPQFKDGFETFFIEAKKRGHEVDIFSAQNNKSSCSDYDWLLVTFHTNQYTVKFMTNLSNKVKVGHFCHCLNSQFDDIIRVNEKISVVFDNLKVMYNNRLDKYEHVYCRFWKKDLDELYKIEKKDKTSIFIIDEFATEDNVWNKGFNEYQLPIKEIAYHLDRLGFNVYIKGHDKTRKYGKFESGYLGAKGLQEIASKCTYVIGKMSSVLIEALQWDCIPIILDHKLGTNYNIISSMDKYIYNYTRDIIVSNPVVKHEMSNVICYIPGITKKIGTDFNTAIRFIAENKNHYLNRIKDFWFYKDKESFHKTVLDYIENR